MEYTKHADKMSKEHYTSYLLDNIKKLEMKYGHIENGQTRFDRIVIDLVKEHISSIK